MSDAKTCACGKPALPGFDTCADPTCEINAWRKWFAEVYGGEDDAGATPVPSHDVPTEPASVGPLTALRYEAYERAAKGCDGLAEIARQKLRAAEEARDPNAIAVWRSSLVACEACAKRIRSIAAPPEEQRKTVKETALEAVAKAARAVEVSGKRYGATFVEVPVAAFHELRARLHDLDNSR